MEIEFKIKMTKSEAEKVLDKIFTFSNGYSIHTKVDRYWKRPGASVTNINVVRVRSDHIVKDQELPDTDEPVKDWFFNPDYNPNHIPVKYTLDDEKYITHKNKTISNGSECNVEREQHISNAIWEIVEKCFDDIGESYFNKIKRCLSFYRDCDDGTSKICVDVCNVNNGYFYFEIETVTFRNSTTDEEREKLLKDMNDYIKSEFGLNPNNKDSRSWMQIIREDKPQ